MQTMRAQHRGHERQSPEIWRVAEANSGLFKRHRRLLRLVDTRQKWMLLHLVALAAAGGRHRAIGRGATANWVCKRAVDLGISSRNTGLAFLDQLAAYGFLRKENCDADRRVRLISLAAPTEAALLDWTATHLELVAGPEAASLGPDGLRRIYLDTIETLLADTKWLKAPLDIRLTQDMRGGWLVMSEILSCLPANTFCEDWLPAQQFSIPSMVASHGLSRSTIYRMVGLSIEAGIMRWKDGQGVSILAVGGYHVRQFERWTRRLLDAVSAAGIRNTSDTSPYADRPMPIAVELSPAPALR